MTLREYRDRAGGSTKVAKVLDFASFGLQILESVNYVDMSCHFINYCLSFFISCNVLMACHELYKPHIVQLTRFHLIKCFFLRIIYLLDVYNKIQVGVDLLPLPWVIREIQDGDQRD